MMQLFYALLAGLSVGVFFLMAETAVTGPPNDDRDYRRFWRICRQRYFPHSEQLLSLICFVIRQVAITPAESGFRKPIIRNTEDILSYDRF